MRCNVRVREGKGKKGKEECLWLNCDVHVTDILNIKNLDIGRILDLVLLPVDVVWC